MSVQRLRPVTGARRVNVIRSKLRSLFEFRSQNHGRGFGLSIVCSTYGSKFEPRLHKLCIKFNKLAYSANIISQNNTFVKYHSKIYFNGYRYSSTYSSEISLEIFWQLIENGRRQMRRLKYALASENFGGLAAASARGPERRALRLWNSSSLLTSLRRRNFPCR